MIEFINTTVCEKNRQSCSELIESKIKLSIINLKLWIVTSIVIFLISTGSTFVCAIRSYAKIEQKVETISEEQKANNKVIENFRQELWKIIPIGRYREMGEESNNNENNKIIYNRTASND